jgi:metal-responsive CopG/Arc/MetJ family transcriptional regulator
VRTHLLLPEDLVEAIDRHVGKRKRSRFVEEAVREKLRREGLLSALEETAGALSAEAYPDWATSEAAARVRESHKQDDIRSDRLRRESVSPGHDSTHRPYARPFVDRGDPQGAG